MKKIKVTFLNPNVPPRAVSLLNRIHSQGNIDINAIFFAIAQKNRRWNIHSKEYERIGFPHTILKSFSLGFGIKDFHNTYLSFGLFKTLRKNNPDIIVLPGWADITSLSALFWGKLHSKKVILRTESTVKEKSWRRLAFYPITKIILITSDLIVGSSKAAEKYASSIYSKTTHTHILSSFDTISFAKKVNKSRKNKDKLKKSLKISQKHCVYFNGQLIDRKGVNELLESFSKLKLKNTGLIISGYGNLESKVSEYAEKYSNIYFVGYATQDQLPDYYAISDAFILPSFEETWGLVVIEGLSAGLPIITSIFVGSSEIITKDRGEVISGISSSSITSAVTKILSRKMRVIGKSNQRYAINKLNYELAADNFIRVFNQIII